MRRRSLVLLGFAAAATACAGLITPQEVAFESDAGAPAVDGAPLRDAAAGDGSVGDAGVGDAGVGDANASDARPSDAGVSDADGGVPGPACADSGGFDAGKPICTGTSLVLVDALVSTYIDQCKSASVRDVWETTTTGANVPPSWSSACWVNSENVPSNQACGTPAASGEFPMLFLTASYATVQNANVYKCIGTGAAERYVVNTTVTWTTSTLPAASWVGSCVALKYCP